MIPVENIFSPFLIFCKTQPCCKLKQQHVGTLTFQHCQIFVLSFWSRDRTNKRLWNFYLSFYFGIISVQLPTPLSSNAGYRIHPYLVGRIIRHNAQFVRPKIPNYSICFDLKDSYTIPASLSFILVFLCVDVLTLYYKHCKHVMKWEFKFFS